MNNLFQGIIRLSKHINLIYCNFVTRKEPGRSSLHKKKEKKKAVLALAVESLTLTSPSKGKIKRLAVMPYFT